MIAARARGASGAFLIVGIVLASLADAIVSTALSLGRGAIIGDTYATPDAFAWLDVGYTASKVVGFALSPWLLLRFRAVTVLVVASLALGAGSAVAAFTFKFECLIALRLAQGLSGAILLVSGQAILFWSFTPRHQPLVQALFALGAVVAPATLAPVALGWLLDYQSWSWIFFAALPLSLAGAGLVLFGRPESPPRKEAALDWPGLLLFGLAMAGTSFILIQGNRWDWFEEELIRGWAIISGGSMILFLLQQARRRGRPLFDRSVFMVGDFSFAFLVSFVAGAALFGSAYLIPAFAIAVLGFTPTDAGLLLLPSAVLFTAALLASAWLIQARHVPPLATVPFGIILTMAAMWLLSGSNEASGIRDMMPAILIRGLGLGLLFLSLTLIAFSRLAPDQIGFGIGIFSIGRQLGGLIGVAGLQEAINDQVAQNQAALSAALARGSPRVVEQIDRATSALMARGLDPQSAATSAIRTIDRAVTGQATVIAFDYAFALLALIFVAAAPVLIGTRIALARFRPATPLGFSASSGGAARGSPQLALIGSTSKAITTLRWARRKA